MIEARASTTTAIKKPVIVDKTGKPVTSAAASSSAQPFTFEIRSLDTDDRVTFINPYMEPYGVQLNSSEDGFHRPFAATRSAQSVDGVTENYTFQNILLDTRYRVGVTKEGGPVPNIEGIIDKLKRMMTPNPFRMRKQRVVFRFGSKMIGVPPETYLYINSVTPKTEMVNSEGGYETVILDISASLYSFK